MKLHISYNIQDLNDALRIAAQTADYADIIGVGSLLILKEGIRSIKAFKAAWPNKPIFAEVRISEKADEAVKILANAGAQYISVLAGTFNHTIKKAVDTARILNVNIILDLLNAQSVGQSAMDAKGIGIHALIMHKNPVRNLDEGFETQWEEIRDNTKLPIIINGKINESNIQEILALKPQGIMIGEAITNADNPVKAAQFFKSLVV